jgi:uncharacterized membrane protein YhaH (DUF805 family)
MNVGQWYVSRGRISRRTFWLHYFLPIFAASIVAGLLDLAFGFTDFASTSGGTTTYEFSSSSGPIGAIVSLALLVPSFSSNVTRLHDRDHSAWWLLFVLLPIIGWIILIVQIGFLPGTPGPNRYGPPVDGRQPMAEPGYPQSYS